MKKKKPSRIQALDSIRTLLLYLGEDPNRPGLMKTPERVIRAWEEEWALGYSKSYVKKQMKSILGGQFKDGAENVSEMVIVKNIKFFSMCEHHMSLFSGYASIGYIPNGKILGLSKLARIVELYSKRLQVQERITNQVADFIDTNCNPLGVGVVIQSSHSCLESRGVKQQEAEAITSALRGEFLTKPEVRSEFLRLVGR